MISAAPPRSPAGTASAGRSWPARSGPVPALAAGYASRLETAPDLAAALPAGTAIALVPGRAASSGQATGSGQATDPGTEAVRAARDWERSSGKTQLAAAFAESLWQSGRLDLLVWIQATSRAAVLSGYAAATATATGRDQASSCESIAAQFLGWLSETSRSWLVVLDGLADPADLDGLWPSGPNGRVLVTCADATVLPRHVPALPVGPFNSREALSFLMERLATNPGQRLGAIDLVKAVGTGAGRADPGQRGDRQLHDVVPQLLRLLRPPEEPADRTVWRTAVGRRGHLDDLVRARQSARPGRVGPGGTCPGRAA